ncbi:ABC transporter substrate-binding protein [Salinadaptatus halalkaliphilus]|uniref:ABC transporter substrate-binding protein n=1 Tax=Salinadaptatus halalkaliphilus TaxID=2419781 RepID=A0A4S3TL43_9EURY|nr:PGF-CTERM-anchored ABC transporter substrate-binding protein [Salinadaptatus halalkaliphilus]THE64776.1 ABC transporter substrate-binding protein [Salinadaptatus halalkaliphilus]
MRRLRSILLCVLVVGSLCVAPLGAVATADSTVAGSQTATEPTTDRTSISTSQSDATCEYPLERTDARGETVTLEDEPDEVVALYPGDAQLAFQIGAEDRIVGMPIGPFTDSLEVDDQTDISADDGVTPVAEEIVALDPDVVIAGNIAMSEEALIEQLEDAGITAYVHERAMSIDDVRENVEATGEFTGECSGADESIAWMDDRLEVVDDALAEEDDPLAYYVSDDEGTTPGTDTFQHEVLDAAGLENVAERAGIEGWQEISAEVVVDEDPEWIIYPDWVDEPPIVESIETTTAFEEGNVVAVDDNAMSQPAPGIVSVVDHLVETVHPDVYDEIESDLEAVDEEYGVDNGLGDGTESDAADGESESGSTDDGDPADDESATDGESDGFDSMPGFGLATALVGITLVVTRVAIGVRAGR